MPITSYPFNREFRERLIALCIEPDWFARFGTQVIVPEYFELEEEQAIVRELLRFYTKYSRTPCHDELLAIFATITDNKVKKILKEVNALIERAFYVTDTTFARDAAIKFAKEQAMKLAFLEGVEDIEHGNLSTLVDRAQKALQVGDDVADLGLDLKADAEKWIFEEMTSVKIPTGMYHLDIAMEGGLGCGELGVILSGTNVGKTQTLVNIGYGAAGLASRHNVVHITCETPAIKVAKRYAARMTFKWLTKEDDPNDYLLSFQTAAGKFLPGHIRIKEFPTKAASVADIRAYVERLMCYGEPVELLIVDYPDEMRHTYIGEHRHMIADTFRGLRGMAGMLHIPIWAATQSNRAALAKELVTLDDIAESYEKAQVSDVIIALCQTKEEEEADQVRFYGAKIRDGEKGWMVRCHVNRGSHAIISDERMSLSDLPSKKRKRGEED